MGGGGTLGHELLNSVADTHPASRRIFYYSGRSPKSLHEALLQKAHQFVTEDSSLNESATGLYSVIRQQLEAFERQPKVQIELDNILIKLADTKYEVENLERTFNFSKDQLQKYIDIYNWVWSLFGDAEVPHEFKGKRTIKTKPLF